MNEEQDFKPNWYSPTGNTIQDVLEERGISEIQFARDINWSLETTLKVLDGSFPINSDMAGDLAAVLGSTKKFWIRRDKHYHSEMNRIKLNNKEEKFV